MILWGLFAIKLDKVANVLLFVKGGLLTDFMALALIPLILKAN